MSRQRYELIWNMTRKCNYRCKYCYYPHDCSPVTESLPASAICALLAPTGKEWVIQMTGGEPLLYPGFVDICETLSRHHRIGVDTNLSVTRRVHEFAERMNPARVKELYVSLHIEERERLGGVQSFIDNVHLLEERGFNVIINYVVHPTLQHRYHDDVAMFATHGLHLLPRPFKGKHEGRRYPDAYDASVADIFCTHPEQGKKAVFSFQGLPCTAGQTILRMEPDGTVMRCIGDRTVLGSIREEVSLPEGPAPCRSSRCPCRCVDHVRLDREQAAFVEGVQFAVTGNAEASTKAFRKVVRGSAYPAAENNLGVLAWRSGDVTSAVDHFRAAAGGCPSSQTYAANLAGAETGGAGFEPELSLVVNPGGGE